MKRPLVIDYAIAGDLSALDQDMSYPAFFADSLCLDVEDDNIFFSEEPKKIAAAKAICMDCPIRSNCLTWAIREEVEGVFGGTDTEERANLSVIGNLSSEDQELLKKQYHMLCERSVKEAVIYFGVNERTIFRWRTITQNVKKAS